MALTRENDPEDVLLKKAASGDRAGLEYLVNAYKDMAYTVAFRIVANREDAEEVVQDSFMRAFASLGKFNRSSKFSTWLYRIVYNTSLTKVKNRKVMVDFDSSLENGSFDISEDTGYDAFKNEERRNYVTKALSKLTYEEYLVISLFYMGEKSISEIQEILGLKSSAIKMRLLRGREILKTELKILLKAEWGDLL